MQNKVKYIDFTFEGCTCIQVPVEHLRHFRLGGITVSIHNTYFDKSQWVHECVFMLSHEIDIDDSPLHVSFECIKRDNNLAQIRINFEDGSFEDFHIIWEDDNDQYTNSHQTTKINSRGDLFLVVNKDLNKFNEIFPDIENFESCYQ